MFCSLLSLHLAKAQTISQSWRELKEAKGHQCLRQNNLNSPVKELQEGFISDNIAARSLHKCLNSYFIIQISMTESICLLRFWICTRISSPHSQKTLGSWHLCR